MAGTAINWRGQLICNKEEHTHNSSCYTCGKEEHVHISSGWDSNVEGGEPCSMVSSGKAQSRLEIAVSAVKNMVDTLRAQLGGKLTAKLCDLLFRWIRKWRQKE